MNTFEYSAAIKITFDKPILNNLEIVTGTEEVMLQWSAITGGVASASSVYQAGYEASKAFDLKTDTMWYTRTAPPQWLKYDFGIPTSFTKVRHYAGGYYINAYELQGSNDDTNWTTIASGNFPNSSVWSDITFAEATYRYWRLYAISKHGTYIYVAEMQFYYTRNTYDVTGWEVTGLEPDKSPEGTPIPTTYTIRRITKADDDYSVILWLDLLNRMKYPLGNVSVAFNGALIGPESSFVHPFVEVFEPVNINKVFNPHGIEKFELVDAIASGLLTKIDYSSHTQPVGDACFKVADVTASGILTHIDDLEQ